MTKPATAVVVGGGVAGLCCAYYLRKRDVEVTVLEADTVGSRVASSYGNGGWICPAQAGPLPEPGLTLWGLRALLRPESPLFFRPSYLPKLAPWLVRFSTYCNRRDFDRGTAALAALGKTVFDLVDGMIDDGLECELYRSGFVCATAAEPDARSALQALDPMRAYGYALPDDILVGEELHALEPGLSERATAGFLVEEQWHVRAHTFVEGLAAILRRDGVEIVERAAVKDFSTHDGTVRAATTARGSFEADAFVLAAGSWTQPLAGRLGVRFPMQPGKGYTFLVRPKVMPRHGILYPDIHAGCTPLGHEARISGTMEFSGFRQEIDQRRIESIFRNVREYIDLETPEYTEPWAGLRPLTPDGLPVLDRAGRLSNAYVVTGYSMLGMTLCQPAGEQIAEWVVSGERPSVLEPFRINRFERNPFAR
jgi:D-amino-acid dehydrogenase